MDGSKLHKFHGLFKTQFSIVFQVDVFESNLKTFVLNMAEHNTKMYCNLANFYNKFLK